jgi:hypothetical protein
MRNNRVRDYPELIEKPPLRLSNNLRTVVNDLAKQMPHPRQCPQENPTESLTPDEISYLQAYLEQVKVNKMNKLAQPTNLKYCLSVGDLVTKNRAQREMAARIPINPYNNASNYGAPTPRDVQPALPGPPSDYEPLPPLNYRPCENSRPCESETGFRNGFGPGTGINRMTDM